MRLNMKRSSLSIIVFLVLLYMMHVVITNCESCSRGSVSSDFCTNDDERSVCKGFYSKQQQHSYLLYEVNPGEGFNLRRDVYMRIATLVRLANSANPGANWILVLPPWGPLYHWKSRLAADQMQIPWSTFFDLPSMSNYVPVMEFHEFLKERGPQIDKVYYLQNYAEGWTSGQWEEKMDVRECLERPSYKRSEDGTFRSWFWGYREAFAADFVCLSVQGRSSTLLPLLSNSTYHVIMIDRAEVILHEVFGDANYWMVRRSMRFAKKLVNIGDEFRKNFLDSDDIKDKTVQSENWMNATEKRNAVGGPYICSHLRRQDFVRARPKDVPSIKNAVIQLEDKLSSLKLNKVFIATDATEIEIKELKKYLPNVITFKPSARDMEELKDGGVAIVEQWVCAHARYFIGTHESTFSFRIQEEREILGFQPDTSFNRLCGDNQTSCSQPSKWKIVFH